MVVGWSGGDVGEVDDSVVVVEQVGETTRILVSGRSTRVGAGLLDGDRREWRMEQVTGIPTRARRGGVGETLVIGGAFSFGAAGFGTERLGSAGTVTCSATGSHRGESDRISEIRFSIRIRFDSDMDDI